jgi:hypothetical protein
MGAAVHTGEAEDAGTGAEDEDAVPAVEEIAVRGAAEIAVETAKFGNSSRRLTQIRNA